MMAEGRFDEACHWYDETIAELVPNNSLILERLKAYRAACEYHINETLKRLLNGKLLEAVAEAQAANRYAAEAPELAAQAKDTLNACAKAYAKRAAANPLKTEDEYRQAIKDMKQAIKLSNEPLKKHSYRNNHDKVLSRFADWLKNQGRLTEATELLAGIYPKTPGSSDHASHDKTSKKVGEEIQQRKQEARDLLKKAVDLLQDGQWEEAVAAFRKTREIDKTLSQRARYGERRALASQASHKTRSAIESRNWEQAAKWLEQWKKHGSGDDVSQTALFVEGGIKSDKLLARANEKIKDAKLSEAASLLEKAIKFPALDSETAGEIDKALRNLKHNAMNAVDSAKELALKGDFAGATQKAGLGESIWSDWSGWGNLNKFISDEKTRAQLLKEAQEYHSDKRFQAAYEKYWKALEIRYDKETERMAKACKDWLASIELQGKSREELEKKNLGSAIALASKSLEKQPENTDARIMLEKAKQLKAESNRNLAQAKSSFQSKNWRETIRLLEECMVKDSSCTEASELLPKAQQSLKDEWGIMYNPNALPAHAIFRHWLVWIIILAMTGIMILFRKTAYIRFALTGSRQLPLREHLLQQKWWRVARIAGSALFLAGILTLVIIWIVYESNSSSLAEKAGQLESSGNLLEARNAHQSILETRPFSWRLPSSRLSIMNISEQLPETERVPVQFRQVGLQNWFEGSRRAVSPYSIDYTPLLVSILSLLIIAFLLSFRLKKRLVPRFLLVVSAIPPFMVLLIELLSTQSVGTGSIALPLSAFSRYIPYVMGHVSLAAAAVLCFTGSSNPELSLLFLARRRADRTAKRQEQRKPMLVGKTKKALLKEELPWLPSEEQPVGGKKSEKLKEPPPEGPRLDPGLRTFKPDKKEDTTETAEPEEPPDKENQHEPPILEMLRQDGRDTVAADDLGRMLAEAEPEMRIEAARALGVLGDPRGLEPLIDALDDSSEGVRNAAAEALIEVGHSDLDLLKIAHNKEKDPAKKELLNQIIAKTSGRKPASS